MTSTPTLDRVKGGSSVREAISDLPEAQAEVLKYAYFEGKSHSEIADETGLAMGTVKSRLRLAYDRLRPALAGKV